MTDTPKAGQICWTELATTDVQAAKAFYGQVFGWEFNDVPVDDMTYTILKNDNKEFGGIWSIPKDQDIPPHWLSYILVEDINQALEKAKKHGATVVKPTAPAGDYGLFAIITDPTGAHIALWENLKG